MIRPAQVHRAWDRAREAVGDVESVLHLAAARGYVTRGRAGLSYPDHLGQRSQRGRADRGEGRIETALLHGGGFTCVDKSGARLALRALCNSLPMGSSKSDKRDADLLCVEANDAGRPVVVEVKVTAANPWHATVQLCEYVLRLRSDRKSLGSWLRARLCCSHAHVGTWGMLLAPAKWWRKPGEAEARKLVDLLHNRTQVRLSFCEWDPDPFRSSGQLRHRYGYLPSA